MKSLKQLILFFTLISIATFTGCKAFTRTVSNTDIVDTRIDKYPINIALPSSDVKVTITYGLNQYAKIGKSMRLKANIVTRADEFHGYVQIQIKSQKGKTNYNNRVDLEDYADCSYEYDIPVIYENMPFTINILDEKKKVILEEAASVKANKIYNIKYVGIFNKQLMEQEKTTRGKVDLFLLTSEELIDAFENMNLLDYVLIQENEISTLTDYQRHKLDEWTKQGGTMLIEKEQYNSEKDKDGTYGFGRYYYLPITDDMNEIVDYIDKRGLNPRILLDGLADSRFKEAVHATVVSKIPNLLSYCILFLIYVVIIGPILYIILKRKNKIVWYWRAVPVISVLFIVIVFVLGKSTRIENDYMRYMDITQIAKDGYTMEKSYVAAVNIDKDSMEICTQDRYDLKPLYTIEDVFNTSYIEHQPTLDFEKVSGLTLCNIDKMKSFDDVYFELKNQYEVTDKSKLNDSSILCSDYKLKGNYTNLLGEDLKYAFIISSQMIVKLGTVVQGQTIDLSNCQYYYLPSSDLLYTKKFSEVLKTFIKEDGEEDDLQSMERLDTIKVILEQWEIENREENYVIGFTEDKVPATLSEIHDSIIDTGMNMVLKEITVDYTNEEEKIFDPFIDRIQSVVSGEYYEDLNIIDSDTLVIDYTLPKGKIIELQYSKNYNTEFFVDKYGDKNLYQGFYGTIYFYNRWTEKYEKVITSGEETVIKNLQNYLTEDNVLRVRYEVAQNSANRNIITVPRLVAIRKGV